MYRALFAAALFAATPALAQDADSDLCDDPAGVTCIEFGTLNIDAPVDGPTLRYVQMRREGDFNPLIQLRTHFNQEMERSTREL